MRADMVEIGTDKRLGPKWVTIDSVKRKNVDHVVRWGKDRLPFPDRSVYLVYSSNVLEHVPWWQTEHAVREVYRVLRRGGTFELWVPNLWDLVERLRADNFPRFKPNLNPHDDPMVAFSARLFYGARTGEEGRAEHYHKSAFDRDYLMRLAKRVGFSDVVFMEHAEDRRPAPKREFFVIGARMIK